jgi:hypothetical protein
MIEEIKKALSPTLSSLKELNTRIGNNNLDGDFLTHLVTNMKLSALQIEKQIKKNKIKIKGGVEYTPPIDDEE